MEPSPTLLWLAVAVPSLVGLASFLLGKRAGYLLTSSSVLSLLLILLPNLGIFLEGESFQVGEFLWWPLGSSSVSFGLIVDPLSLLMGTIVAFISSLVFLYSLEYMRHEEGVPRFWFFMGCFESSMLLLVFSNNLIMTLIGWEGVGLSSFFLIGHYYRDPRDKWLGGPEGVAPFTKPSLCGLKALLTTGIADSLMLVGVLMMFSLYGTFNYAELSQLAAVQPVNPPLLLLASVLIVFGPLGKSAQFPFQEWLPEAMAGPTPVSALLHSATMVKAGVYLIARLSIIFYALGALYPAASAAPFLTVTLCGLATVILGSLYGGVAIEMKKILAYSTISQLGYMMVALGIGGISGSPLLGMAAALFHLLSHSIFKAALFMSAGSVIHATHTTYVTEMGAMRKAMPKTFVAMGASALSLMALPPLMGFWSKDAILAAVYPANLLTGLALAGAAALTAFYSLRMLYYAFFGAPKREPHRHHEALLFVLPPLFLAALTLALGFAGLQTEELFHEVVHNWLHMGAGYEADTVLALASSLLALALGVASAYLLYFRRTPIAAAFSRAAAPLRDLLWGRPFDRSYGAIVSGGFTLSRWMYSFEMLLNRSNNALASGTMKFAKALSDFHSGDLNRYLAVAATLMLILLLIMLAVSLL